MISEMENKLKRNESGMQKAGNGFAYPCLPVLWVGSAIYLEAYHRRLPFDHSSEPMRPFSSTGGAVGSRLSIVIVTSDNRLLQIQDPSEVCAGQPVGRVSGKEFFKK